jgi:hypothetical protein
VFRGNELQGSPYNPFHTHTHTHKHREIGSVGAFMFAAGIRILLSLKLHGKHLKLTTEIRIVAFPILVSPYRS